MCVECNVGLFVPACKACNFNTPYCNMKNLDFKSGVSIFFTYVGTAGHTWEDEVFPGPDY